MTITYHADNTLRGTTAERTGGTWTNLPIGWVFIESNGLAIYRWNGTTWDLLGSAGGTTPIASGGTGQTTATAAFDALSPMTTAGDVIYGGASGTRTRLAIGTANQLLRVNSGATAPEYASTLSGLTLTTPTINTPTVKYTDVSKVNTDSPYSILTTDNTIRLNATSGAITATLPTAVGATGKEYEIRRTDILASSNIITIATTSSQTISGCANWYLSPGEFLKVKSDNANWEAVSHVNPSAAGYYYAKGASNDIRVVAGDVTNSALLTSTTSPVINLLWAIPIIVGRVTKFDKISFCLGTAGVANARCGLYRDNGNCYPGALIFDTGAIDCSSGTIKDTTITAGLQVLPPGLYWCTWECDAATIQIRAIPNSAVLVLLGHSASMTANPGRIAYTVAHTFGALPDPYTAGGAIITTSTVSAPVPAVALRPI